MTRVFGLMLCVTLVALCAFALGRAMDVEDQDRVIFTSGGITFDCAREFVEAGESILYEDGSSAVSRGEVTYTDCHEVP